MQLEHRIEGADSIIRRLRDPKLIGPSITKAMRQSAEMVARHARRRAPKDLGHMSGSIKPEYDMRRPYPLWARIGPNVSYGPYVEFGTGIYGPEKRPIRPTEKKALAWPSKAGNVILTKGAHKGERGFVRRSVKGMKPRPYMRPALPAAMSSINRIWKAAADEIERKWGQRL